MTSIQFAATMILRLKRSGSEVHCQDLSQPGCAAFVQGKVRS